MAGEEEGGMTDPIPDWLLLARYCHANPDRGEFDGAVVAGRWEVIMAQCSHADLRPIRVRRAKERRRAG
jgi:hypothetical protein